MVGAAPASAAIRIILPSVSLSESKPGRMVIEKTIGENVEGQSVRLMDLQSSYWAG